MAGGDPALDPRQKPAPTKASEPSTEEVWRGILLGTDPRFGDSHAFFARLPGNPRCYMCSAPFKGPGAIVARRMGRRPWAKNTHYCNGCFSLIETQQGGAEVDCSLLFADVRGSTAIAERMSPTEFRGLLDRFYALATTLVIDHDGSIDKFVGDELVAMYFPLLSGERHAERAVATARALLRATGHTEAAGPWLPLGAGVHTGPAWVGAVGDGLRTELTALGDT